jgi:RND family efflux transporter MFP subunit
MKPWTWFLLLLVALAALVGWRIKANAGEEEEQGMGRGRRTPVVQVVPATSATIQDTIEAVGSLESPHKVELSPKSSGRIQYLEARVGDEVRAGQVLAQIDPSESDAQVLQAQASLAQARARLAEAKLRRDPSKVAVSSQIEREEAAVRSAEAELEQVRRNSESSVQSAQAQVGDAESRVKAAGSQVTNAEAVVAREKATLKNAQTRLARVEDLYRQGFIAAQEVDDAKTAVDVQAGNVKVAEAQVASARQARASAGSQLEVARLQLSMTQKTAQSDVAAAEARAVEARSLLKVARANEAENPAYDENVAALQAAVDAAQAQLDLARSVHSNTVLSSTIDGVVTARNADPGSLASPGTPLLVVQSLEWLFFKSSLPVEAMSLVKQGQTVQVTVDGVEGRTFEGKVTHVNLVADEASRQFDVQVRLENPDRALRPGMFGRIRIVTREVEASVAVPKESVRETDQGRTVTVVGEDMKAQVRHVETGATDGKLVEIVSGVEPDEQVVTLSYMPLRDGQDVQFPTEEPKGEGRPRRQ